MSRSKLSQNNRPYYATQRSPVNRKTSQQFYFYMENILFKKKRYVFQILKQFYLFPEGSSSSVMTIDEYDKLIFEDDKIHTLVKKLETKMIERKIWAFLNIKALKILQQVNEMTIKVNQVIRKKTEEFQFDGFQKIKQQMNEPSRILPKKNPPRRPVIEQPSISEYSRVKATNQRTSTTVVTETEEISYGRQANMFIHRGSHSRSHSRESSPHIDQSSYSRILNSESVRVYHNPSQVNQQRQIHYHPSPQRRIIQVSSRSQLPSPSKKPVSQVQKQYRNCYRIAPTIVRVVSCGCEHLLQQCCECTTLMNRLCGCSTCCHTCMGCQKCDCCHGHCQCGHSRSRSGSHCSRSSYSRERISSIGRIANITSQQSHQASGNLIILGEHKIHQSPSPHQPSTSLRRVEIGNDSSNVEYGRNYQNYQQQNRKKVIVSPRKRSNLVSPSSRNTYLDHLHSCEQTDRNGRAQSSKVLPQNPGYNQYHNYQR